MKNYIVKSFHEVFVDDYNEGELNHVNGYELSDEVQADTVHGAVTKYLQDNLGYNLDFKNCEVNPDDKANLQTYCLVDVDNMQPSNEDIELWKQGKATLYANYIDMFIYEVSKVVFN